MYVTVMSKLKLKNGTPSNKELKNKMNKKFPNTIFF
jgi:hypothetical protein